MKDIKAAAEKQQIIYSKPSTKVVKLLSKISILQDPASTNVPIDPVTGKEDEEGPGDM